MAAHPTTHPLTITVRAARDFHVGPRKTDGTRAVAIRRGELRHVTLPAGVGREGALFYTHSDAGTRFGPCRIGAIHGWEIAAGPAPRSREWDAELCRMLDQQERMNDAVHRVDEDEDGWDDFP